MGLFVGLCFLAIMAGIAILECASDKDWLD